MKSRARQSSCEIDLAVWYRHQTYTPSIAVYLCQSAGLTGTLVREFAERVRSTPLEWFIGAQHADDPPRRSSSMRSEHLQRPWLAQFSALILETWSYVRNRATENSVVAMSQELSYYTPSEWERNLAAADGILENALPSSTIRCQRILRSASRLD